MVTFKHSSTLSSAAKLPLVLSLFLVASCSSDKPEYDLGPRRSPQDNQSIIRSMTVKPEAPRPLLPGYDIPAPRFSTPRMIDAPGAEMSPPSPRQPYIAPQSYIAPAATPMASMSAVTEGRRRPVHQFSAGAPGMPMAASMMNGGFQAANVASAPYASYTHQPVYVNPPKKDTFFDKIKNIFHKKEKPEPKRLPGGQTHLAPMGVTAPGNELDNKGFSVETNEPSLEEELRGFPRTPAERAADLSLPERQEKVPAGKPISAAPSQKPAFLQEEEKAASQKLNPVYNAPKPTATVTEKPAPAKGFNPFSFFKAKPSEPKQAQQLAPVQKKPVGNGPLWEDEKLDNQNLEKLSDTPVSENKQPDTPASQKTTEKAEVLMQFDIGEDGELVKLSDIEPAAGKEEASSSILQEVVEPAKPSSKQ